jgi:hypothetical protein
MKYLTIEDKIEHCKTSILVCKEIIKVEGPNGDVFWVNFKKQCEKKLELKLVICVENELLSV